MYLQKLLTDFESEEIHDSLDEKWEKLYNQMVRNSKSIAIISAESLSNTAEFTYLFKSASKYFKIKVIGYFRPQVYWIPSAWKQWHLKEGMSLDNFVDLCVANKHPDYLSNFTAWEDCFGKENLHIKPLVRNCLHKGCLLRDFTQAAGIYEDDLDFDVPEVNISFKSSILRILEKNSDIFKSAHDCALDRFLEKNRDVTTSKNKEYLLSLKQHRTIHDSFYDMNREIHQKYFPEADFDLIFKSEQIQERNEFSLVDDLAQASVTQLKLLQILDSELQHLNNKLMDLNNKLMDLDYQMNKIRKGPLKRMATRFSKSIKKRTKGPQDLQN